MHQQVAVIRQNPLRLAIPLDADRQLAGLALQLEVHLVADRLTLPLVRPGADHEVIGKRGDAGEVQHLDVGCFLGFGGANGQQPVGDGRFFLIGFGQIYL